MYNYLYNAQGEAVGTVVGQYIYAMNGTPIGYLESTHVYRLDGPYVGELYRDMIVDQWLTNPGGIGRVLDPGKIPPSDNPGSRGPMEYGYPDVFYKLVD
jgi:hypothetical protein